MALLSTDMIEEIRLVAEEYSLLEYQRRLSLGDATRPAPRRKPVRAAKPAPAK